MQLTFNFPVETSRNFFDHIGKKVFNNINNDKLQRLQIEIFVHKNRLEANNDEKDSEYIQLADNLLNKISNTFKQTLIKSYKDTEYSEIVAFVAENLNELKRNPFDVLGDYCYSEKALKILKFAANELNFTNSQCILGSWYHYGKEEAGIAIDLPTAKSYYQKAAPEDELARDTLEHFFSGQ